MTDFFSYEEDEYRNECKGLSSQELQDREVHLARSVYSQWAGLGFGIGATIGSAGVAAPLPFLSGRMLEIAYTKHKAVQLELVDRCVQLHEDTWGDWGKGMAAFGVGQILTHPLGGVMPGAEDGITNLIDVGSEVVKFIPGEIANSAAIRVTDEFPPEGCPRKKRYRHLRLKCAKCSKCFDTSYTEFLHCCDCNDRFDVCADCALKLEHDKSHKLYRMKPDSPKVPSSWRSSIGKSLKCNGCNNTMKSTDYYSCSECLRRYNVCLGCYGKGNWCQKHRVPLHRRRV